MTDMPPAPISVERLRELLEKANGLPWRWSENGNIVPLGYPHGEWDFEIAAVYTERDDDEAPANAELIIEAVNALPALLHQLAEREAEVERLRDEKNAMFIRARELAERCGAAERAREEFRLLASLQLFHAPTIGYCWFESCGVSWTGKTHATMKEANAEKTAAFLAASGGGGHVSPAGAPTAQQPLDESANNAGVATGSRNDSASESVTRGSLPASDSICDALTAEWQAMGLYDATPASGGPRDG